ncbi:MAG: hypothetical protein AAF738_08530, partial [Bacteroidota bacterium]
IEYEAFDMNGERVKVNNFLMLPKGVQYAYASGVFSSSILESLPDTLDFDFSNRIDGNLYFEQPKVTVTIGNSFGLPADLRFSQFDIVTKNGTLLPLESEFIDEGFQFNFPSFEEVGETKTTKFVFDHTNSNLPEIIGAGPVGLLYELDAITNPEEDTPGFLTDESAFSYHVEAEFPLFGRLQDLIVRDTLPLEAALEDLDDVRALEFKVVTENRLPLATELQAYFLTETGNVLDSLFTEDVTTIIEAAPINASGETLTSNRKIIFATMDNARIKNIQNARQVLIDATFNTSQNLGSTTSVRIQNDQILDIRMGIKARL